MLLQNLNSEQRKAVETTEGRVLILAGAGSGKTKVLTVRIAYLIEVKNVSPQSILGLTFTNKAALEMRKRMGELISSKQASKVVLSTFHSFCLKVLREDISHLGYTSQFTLYDQADVERLVKIIARDIIGREADMPSLQPTMNLIAKARSKGLKAEEIIDSNSWHEQFTREVYKRLIEAFRAYNALDFDSLLLETVRLFENYPEVLLKYQNRFQYVMIDEYQDTNPIQYRLAELLTAKSLNLCVVGDDDQSIYGWRGAEVKNILEFSGASIIKLEQNYRSTNTILEAANQVIRENQTRHSKKLWSQKGGGAKIEVFHAPTDLEEAMACSARIAKMKDEKKVPWSHFAILYRSNNLSRQMELALLKQPWKDQGNYKMGVPYRIYGGQEFYERKEVKDLVSYLKVSLNPLDEEAILRVINFPRRGIGEGALDKITQHNRQNKLPLYPLLEKIAKDEFTLDELQGKALKGIKTFYQVIEELKHDLQSDKAEALKKLSHKIDFKKAIEEEVKSDKMREFKWENVEELISALAAHPGSLTDFLADNFLDQKHLNSLEHPNEDKVSLMTFHSAKGLEFPHCFLIGLEDHIIPHERSIKEGSLEEERRLMYVALTRARENLTLSMARSRQKMGQPIITAPSRFLNHISKDLFQIVKWDQI